MRLIKRLTFTAILGLLFLATAIAQPAGNAKFNTLVDGFFEEYYSFYPSEATAAGFHEFDSRLEDYSAANFRRERAWFLRQLTRFGSIDRQGLSVSEKADLDLVVAYIRAHLLAIENIRQWQKDPDIYLSGINGSVFTLAIRNSAPLATRLSAVIARERQMPAALRAARRNVRNPPRIYTEVALENIDGVIGFFEKDLPLAFKDVTDTKLQAEFHESNSQLVLALKRFKTYLKELLPRSKGNFRIGAENFRKKLLYDEMVDIPLPRLLKIGMENLRRNQAEFRRIAALINPSKSAREILEESQKDHPPPDQLLSSIKGVLGGLQSFIRDHHIITIPSDVPPHVLETPPFMRSTTTASMDTPGAYEKSTDAFYFATLPDPSWPADKINDFMGGFTYGTILSTSIHEAYPGHYTQFLWIHNAPSKLRKLISCGSNAEGWAHYTEQMMLDEGYSNNDPKMRLGQLQDALLRNARFIVGIKLHTGTMSYQQAIDFFVKEGYQSHEIAVIESRRGTSDPTYLIYTLGKLAILKLREDYRSMRKESFTLQDFHDQFMRQGAIPITLIRRALLGKEGKLL